METKKPWQSKTLWTALVSAVLPFIPGVQVWVLANPEAYSALLGLVFAGLRTVSKEKITIK